jgi:hypothetical protein
VSEVDEVRKENEMTVQLRPDKAFVSKARQIAHEELDRLEDEGAPRDSRRRGAVDAGDMQFEMTRRDGEEGYGIYVLGELLTWAPRYAFEPGIWISEDS